MIESSSLFKRRCYLELYKVYLELYKVYLKASKVCLSYNMVLLSEQGVPNVLFLLISYDYLTYVI